MPAMTLRVQDAQSEADLIRGIELVAEDASPLPPFTPGAHVEVTLPDGDTRPYSLVDFDGSCAAPRSYRFGVRLEDDSAGGSRFMHGLAAGDTVTVSEPVNDFPLAEDGAPSLLLAGGIGVTPIISMAAALRAAGRDYRFVYAARSRPALAFGERLAAEHGDRLTVHIDDEVGGPLDVGGTIAAAPAGAHLYVCGPRPMIDAAREAAEQAGFGPERIHFELFESAAQAEGDTAFEVELASSGQVFTIPPGRTIIEVLEEAGIDLIHDCQRGDCGICQTDVLEGEPDHRDVVLSDAERAAGNVMQICVSRAKSARLKLDL
ncbi:oxidoreductase [Rhodobacteraceae bacterium WD3A24]|nr:oxidoreductase [Rhodobacteraceae bacterium WD3A24]